MGEHSTTYKYDSKNRLTEERNAGEKKITQYTYDNGGNITRKTIIPYNPNPPMDVPQEEEPIIRNYTYGNSAWKDQLTAYNGTPIVYDKIGNPTNYMGATLTWQGRQLTSFKKDTRDISYKYDSNGLRTYKKVGKEESRYLYLGGKLAYEERGDKKLWFSYDALGTLIGITYKVGDGEYQKYAVYCNSRRDVEGLYGAVSGKLYAKYSYDAWGELMSIKDANGSDITSSTHIGIVNPLRYRSYYYDTETSLYYLQSRYYNPMTKRFLNADGMIKTPGVGIFTANMYAYCENNPVANSDTTGEWFGLDDAIAAGVGALVGLVSQAVSDTVASAASWSWQFSNWETYVGAGLGGAIGGVATVYTGPIGGIAVGCGSSTLIGQSIENATGSVIREPVEILGNSLVDAAVGATVGAIAPIKIPGITKGRNSMSAVFQSGLTKLGNGTASRMSVKVMGKGVVSGVVADLGVSSTSGFKRYLDGTIEMIDPNVNATASGPLFWSAP